MKVFCYRYIPQANHVEITEKFFMKIIRTRENQL